MIIAHLNRQSEIRGGYGRNCRRDRFEGEQGELNASNSALEAVVLKRLKDISA